jgi:hypothetical protein
MRALPLSIVAAVAFALLGPTGAMVAEDTDQPMATVVTGTESCETVRWGTQSVTTEGPVAVSHFYDHVADCRDETSDPRVSGVFRNTFNEDCYYMGPRSEACVIWGTHVLAGGQGGWDCSYAGTDDLWGDNAGHVLVVCPGTGEYDGLTYVFHHVFGGVQDFGDGADIHGLIYEGPPPAWGPAIEPEAE